jgi:hypothetical protein
VLQRRMSGAPRKRQLATEERRVVKGEQATSITRQQWLGVILTPLAAAVVLNCLSKSLWRVGFERRLRVKLPIQYQRLQCRYEDEQDDRPDKHATYNHGSERPLDLAPYTGRNGCRKQADAGRERGH